MAAGASASNGTGVSSSVSVAARAVPPRFFGYTFLGNAKKVFYRCAVSFLFRKVIK